MLSFAADRVLPSKTPVKVWLFSDRLLADPKFAMSASGGRDFAPLADFYIRKPVGRRDTFGAPLMRRFVEEAHRHKAEGERVCFILVTDGGFTDLAEIKKISAELARCPAVAGVWVGPVALQDNVQASVEDAFSPLAAQGKLVVTNRLDTKPGAKRFKEMLYGKR